MEKEEFMHDLPATGYLRMHQIIGCARRKIPALIPVSRSTWWAGVKSGRFPKPVKISPRCTAWQVKDIHSLMDHFNGGNVA